MHPVYPLQLYNFSSYLDINLCIDVLFLTVVQARLRLPSAEFFFKCISLKTEVNDVTLAGQWIDRGS